METTQPALGGSPFNLQGGGGVAGGVFVAHKLFISTRLAENVNTCLYMFV